MIILKWVLKKLGVSVYVTFISSRLESSGGFVVYVVMALRVPYNTENSLTS
jgi:hypothetical protein